MMPRRSPTLELANKISEARRAGQIAFSLSTPTFPALDEGFELTPGWSLLSPARGLPALRDAALPALFGKWELPRHEIMITAGAKAAIFSVLRAALPPGSGILIVGPFWPSYLDLAAAAALNGRPMYTDARADFALDPPELARIAKDAAAKAIILSNPNNPTGRVYTPLELDALLEICERQDILLIIDESFSGITFDQVRWRESRVRSSDRLVVVNSFSKNLHLQGLRVGAVLLPPQLLEPVTVVHQTVMSAAPSLSQQAALAFLGRNSGEPDYSDQRRLMRDFIIRHGWRFHDQSGTFYFFPEIPNLGKFTSEAARRGIFLLAGDCFGTPYGRHVRTCFAKPIEELTRILDNIEDALATMEPAS